MFCAHTGVYIFTPGVCGGAFIPVQQSLTEELPVSLLSIDRLIVPLRCKHESMRWRCNKQGSVAVN